ncbi:MAG TPA: Nif3-like dinuclear metal center hexameric protein [Chitinophagaceae bacterium]|nr:Nif3-like dinuclear metal center hexameric protein [Chitinophagaceae bacterium]
MKISDITQQLETIAPAHFQESYDNAGLIIGDASAECTGIIISLDAIEAVIDEAISKKCNLVVAHHPIIFRGLKKLNGKNYVERTILKAIKNDIAIYAIHTNLDNIKKGVNAKIAEKIGLRDLQILQPKENILKKLITFAPKDKAEDVRKALFSAGGGELGKYSECSFNTEGTGTFKPLEGADPFVGEIGKRHEENELKIEVIFPGYIEQKIIRAMIEAHPYEEVAYDIISLGNYLSDIGSGLIGDLEKETDGTEFLRQIKSAFGLKVIKHTSLPGKKVKKVAVCGGAGSFLIPVALSNKADVYITSDIKYHEFFDAESMVLLDIGHYESEQFTIDLLHAILSEKYPNFAVRKTGVNTNPVQYFL